MKSTTGTRMTDNAYMLLALECARSAAENGEVPIGAIICGPEGCVIATGRNRTIGDTDPTAHAEVVAMRAAARTIDNYRLTGCTVYTTIEPCTMCAGALVNARIARVVYGARDERFGAVDTHFRICDNEVLNHRLQITGGVLAEECRDLMQQFFRERRERP